MKVTKGLHEILSTRFWDMHPDVLATLRSNIFHNITAGVEIAATPALDGSFVLTSSSQFQERLYLGDAEVIADSIELQEDDRIINVLNVCGPITRDGGGCSYGSRDHRDWLMHAADMPETIGHVIIINSGGGSSASKYDYEQAIDYIHSKDQKVIAFIDGMADSAAYALASLCDEVYVMNLNNEVGCIGTMCSFYMQRHGDVNTVTQERYVELYAPDSPYKNREFREAADENYEAIIEELSTSAQDFKELVRKHRPEVTEEQLEGDTYKAGEVIGTLVDGQKTFEECVARLLELSGYSMVDGMLVPPAAGVDDDEDDDQESKQVINNENINQNLKDMGKEYPRIMAACNAQALISDKEDAVYLHSSLCEALEANLAVAEQNENALSAKTAEVVALTEKLNAMEVAHAAEIEKLNTEHIAALDDLKSAHETAMKEAADKAAGEIEGLKAEHEKAVSELSDKLAAADKAIADKEAEIVELAEKPAAPEKGDAPADNATGATAKVRESLTAVRPGMTAKERREALRKLEDDLARRI